MSRRGDDVTTALTGWGVFGAAQLSCRRDDVTAAWNVAS